MLSNLAEKYPQTQNENESLINSFDLKKPLEPGHKQSLEATLSANSNLHKDELLKIAEKFLMKNGYLDSFSAEQPINETTDFLYEEIITNESLQDASEIVKKIVKSLVGGETISDEDLNKIIMSHKAHCETVLRAKNKDSFEKLVANIHKSVAFNFRNRA